MANNFSSPSLLARSPDAAPPITLRYIPGVDGLRAVAVIAVMLFHLNPAWLPGGFVGVDVFFVISGYVVSASLAADRNQRLRDFIAAFYARRVRRIFPVLVLCLVLTTLVAAVFLPWTWNSDVIARTGMMAYYGMGNIALTRFSDGYFAPTTEFNPFTHTWSLGVEEQFYVIFPLIFYFVLRERRNVSSVFFWLMPLLIAVSLIFDAWQTSADPQRAFFQLPARFWELACGAALFQCHHRNRLACRRKRTVNLSFYSGLALIAYGLLQARQDAFPFPDSLPAVAGSLLLINAVASRVIETTPLAQGILANAATVFVGKLSYSLYLWHWPVYVLMRWTCGLDSPVHHVLALGLTVGLSLVSYFALEAPLKGGKFKALGAGKTILVGVLVIVLGLMLTRTLLLKKPNLLRLSQTQQQEIWLPLNWPDAPDAVRENLFQGRTLFVVGDSHAQSYKTLFAMLENRQGAKVRIFSWPGCSLLNLMVATSPRCQVHLDEAMAEIQRDAKAGDVVFFASLRSPRLTDRLVRLDEQSVRKQYIEEPAGVRETLAKEREKLLAVARDLSARQLTVLVDAPKPIFRTPAFFCADWFTQDKRECRDDLSIERDFLLTLQQDIRNTIASLPQANGRIHVWDSFPLLCPPSDDRAASADSATAARCYLFHDNKPLFYDGDHLSAHGNRLLYPHFVARLKDFWVTLPNRASSSSTSLTAP